MKHRTGAGACGAADVAEKAAGRLRELPGGGKRAAGGGGSGGCGGGDRKAARRRLQQGRKRHRRGSESEESEESEEEEEEEEVDSEELEGEHGAEGTGPARWQTAGCFPSWSPPSKWRQARTCGELSDMRTQVTQVGLGRQAGEVPDAEGR